MKNLNILFYLKSRENSKGEHQIYLRLTVDSKRKETSLNRSISSKKWNKVTQRGNGRSEAIATLNNEIDFVKHDIQVKQQEMLYNDQDITAETLMNKYLGIGEKMKNLIEVIREDNIYTIMYCVMLIENTNNTFFMSFI